MKGLGPVVVGIDASRNRSGGALAHINGVLAGADPRQWGIDRVHLWGHDRLIELVSDQSWLVKHRVSATRKGITRELIWQGARLPHLARQLGVDVMFNTADGSVCSFRPCVTLSQNMLLFDRLERERLHILSKDRLRLELLRLITVHRMRRSDQVLFLTEYVRETISCALDLPLFPVVPHGIYESFFEIGRKREQLRIVEPLRCLYVSNVSFYKHQWHVVEAIARARIRTGLDLRLRLVGGGVGRDMERLQASLSVHDPRGEFTEVVEFLTHSRIAEELRQADLFVFASSCENLPVTLLEAMAANLPIACSDRGPMPEVLGPDGVYFDPECPESIAEAVSRLATSADERKRSAQSAFERAQKYTWAKCAAETWRILALAARGLPLGHDLELNRALGA